LSDLNQGLPCSLNPAFPQRGLNSGAATACETDQSFAPVRHVLFRYEVFLRGSAFYGEGKKATKVSVSLKIGCQENYTGTVPDRDFRPDDRLYSRLYRCLIEPHRSVN